MSIILCLAASGCRENQPGPIVQKPTPGRRNYVWTVDTLAYPGSFETLMLSMWASSTKDVYVAGLNDRGYGKMYHYNGWTWAPVRLMTSEGGSISGNFLINLLSIWGFNANDVYAAGEKYVHDPISGLDTDSSLIIHFDGIAWREVSIERADLLNTIAGSSPSDIWAAGVGPESFYHYDGNRWNRDSVPVTVPDSGSFQINSIATTRDSEFHALAVTHINYLATDIYYHFEFLRGEWKLLESAVVEPGHVEVNWGYGRIWRSPWGDMYSVGLGVFQWRRSVWNTVLKSQTWLRNVFGTSPGNMFVVGYGGTLCHFNGIDWYTFEQFKSTEYFLSDGWTDGNEVFVVGAKVSGDKSIVLHGR